MKLVPESGPGPPFWVPTEGLDVFLGLFAPMWPYSAPRVVFWRMPGFIFGVIWSPKSMKVGVDFRCFFSERFLEGFGVVLGLFWVFFWCHNDGPKEKGRFVEMLVLHT